MNLRGLSEAGRREQESVNRGKLLYKNRLERGRSCQMGKAINIGYCGQKYLGFSLSDYGAKELLAAEHTG